MQKNKSIEREDRAARNQSRGFGKQVQGTVDEVIGTLTGDTPRRLHGKMTKMMGKAQRRLGETDAEWQARRRRQEPLS
jgi:uncharacterized protein YjbJ (UPF0337 family)